MNINGIGTNFQVNKVAQQNAYVANNANSTSSNEIDDTYTQSRESETFQKIVGNYDLNNISATKLQDMGKELYDNNLITADEKATITKAANCPLKHLPVQHGPNGDYVRDEDMEHPENVSEDYSKLWKDVEKDTENSPNTAEKTDATKVLELFDKINAYQKA